MVGPVYGFHEAIHRLPNASFLSVAGGVIRKIDHPRATFAPVAALHRSAPARLSRDTKPRSPRYALLVPELPEVETIRRTLAPHIVGRRIASLTLHRKDIVTGAARRPDLLHNCTITSLARHGKQLAIVAQPDRRSRERERPVAGARGSVRALVVHLGMTGQLLLLAPNQPPTQTDHIHAQWTLADTRGRGRTTGTLLFRDPRRFGGLFTYRSLDALQLAWSSLGPDALEPPPHDHPSLARLWRSRRAIKAALLDQSCIAGVGNIYADESLFRAGIHPARRANSLKPIERAELLNAVRAILHQSLDSGGSTLRDYRDARGDSGSFQSRHQVYGRGGEPCIQCGRSLSSKSLGQRTTVWCPNCQPIRPRQGSGYPQLLPMRPVARSNR